MTDENESLLEYLERRERQTLNRVELARANLEGFEEELRQIRAAKAAIHPPVTSLAAIPFGALPASDIQRTLRVQPDALKPLGLQSLANALSSPSEIKEYYAKKTIKELIILALQLNRQFHRDGAKASEIREFILDSFGRNIDRLSMAPQISRLHKDGLIAPNANGGWLLKRSPMAVDGIDSDEPLEEGPLLSKPTSAPTSNLYPRKG